MGTPRSETHFLCPYHGAPQAEILQMRPQAEILQMSTLYTLHPALRKRNVKKIRRAERGSEAKKTTRPGDDA